MALRLNGWKGRRLDRLPWFNELFEFFRELHHASSLRCDTYSKGDRKYGGECPSVNLSQILPMSEFLGVVDKAREIDRRLEIGATWSGGFEWEEVSRSNACTAW